MSKYSSPAPPFINHLNVLSEDLRNYAERVRQEPVGSIGMFNELNTAAEELKDVIAEAGRDLQPGKTGTPVFIEKLNQVRAMLVLHGKNLQDHATSELVKETPQLLTHMADQIDDAAFLSVINLDGRYASWIREQDLKTAKHELTLLPSERAAARRDEAGRRTKRQNHVKKPGP